MDIYKIKNWLNDNHKKIVVFSHILMLVTLINLVVAMFTESFALYPSFFIWSFVLQLIVFFTTQMDFKEKK
jgi:hypothetical protein